MIPFGKVKIKKEEGGALPWVQNNYLSAPTVGGDDEMQT
jgi:hypothetical protein